MRVLTHEESARIAEWYPYALTIVRKMHRGLKSRGVEVSFDDLMTEAHLGMVSAVTTYVEKPELTFKQWLARKVRGRIKDALRACRWAFMGHDGRSNMPLIQRLPNADNGGQDLADSRTAAEPTEADYAALAKLRLSSCEERIIRMLFGDGMTVGEAAEASGVSHSRISRVRTKALTRARELCVA